MVVAAVEVQNACVVSLSCTYAGGPSLSDVNECEGVRKSDYPADQYTADTAISQHRM